MSRETDMIDAFERIGRNLDSINRKAESLEADNARLRDMLERAGKAQEQTAQNMLVVQGMLDAKKLWRNEAGHMTDAALWVDRTKDEADALAKEIEEALK